MPSLPKRTLHLRVLEAAGTSVQESSDLTTVPFVVCLKRLGAVSFYAFTLTAPPGGRPLGEYKIQLILPGQARGQRGSLTVDPDAFAVIAGWSEEEGVFALWDAYAYPSFAYSRNLQVKGETVWRAQALGVSWCNRELRRSQGVETVVACRKDRLLDGLRDRMLHSARRLNGVQG